MIRGASRFRLGLRLAAVLTPYLLVGSETTRAVEQERSPAWQVVGAWREPQGLPQSSVFTIQQTRDGYIWVGTKAGLARFDGARFTTFDDRDASQLLENEVWDLDEGSDGSLWITTYGGGISRLKDGRFRVYTEADGLASNFVRGVCTDSTGGVWIGTDGGLSHFVNDRFVNYTAPDSLPSNSVTELYCDPDGSVWIATDSELTVFRKGSFVARPLATGTAGFLIRSMHRTRDGAMWVATNNGLYRLGSGGDRRYTTADGLSSNVVGSLDEDQAGRLWLATDRGLDVFTPGPGTVRKASPLIGTDVFADREGSIWVGSLRNGLSRLLPEQFVSYTAANGLVDDVVNTTAEGRHGNVWIGTAKGLNRLFKGRFSTYGAESGLRPQMIGSIAEDRHGYLWVGANDGLYRSDTPTNCTDVVCKIHFTYLPDTLFPRMLVRVIFEARDGAVWIGSTNAGLVRYQNGVFRTFTTKDGLSSDAIRVIAEDKDGSLWIGTRGGGLNHMTAGGFTALTHLDGLTNDSVHAIYMDADNTLWFGTRQGMHRLKQGRLSTFTVKDGLFSNFVNSIVEDAAGTLWMACNKGVFSISKQQLNAFADGRATAVTSAVYGLEHGLIGTVLTVGHQPGASRSADGRIWFPIEGGLSVVDPSLVLQNRVPPPVHIEDVLIDNRAVGRGLSANAPPGSGNLVFRYAGLSFLAPEKVRFKYRLEGYEADWVDAGTRREAFYNNIRPGDYTFRVIAANNNGVWNTTGDSVTLHLAPHFYQTYWFYSASLVLVVLVIVSMHRVRVRQLRLREEQLEHLVGSRTAELQQQKTFLRKIIDLNPNFVFARNREGRFTLANKTLADAYGTTVDELIGKTDAEVINVMPSHAEAVRLSDLEVLNTGAEQFIPEFELHLRTGTRRWMTITKIPLLGADGKVDELLGVATDITPQKQAAIEMQRAKEAAEAATRAKSSFLANMSHELRTPMNAVIGMTDLLNDTDLSEEQREFVATVRTGGDSLLAVINDILDFSKIESGMLSLEQAPFSIRTCLDEALDLVSGKAAEKRLELLCEIDPETPGAIVGDMGRLRQILVNILTNAVKFTDRGEVVISVTSALASDGRVELHVAVGDTGRGIPQSKLGLLFRSFSQVDSSATRQHGGTGLGLAISKRLTEMMDGRIWVESDEGIGSTFHVTLLGTPVPERGPSVWDAPTRLAGQRVLVVDDNDTSRRILASQLSALGMTVDVASSGAEALALAERGASYDVAALDLYMPGMDGVALAKALRSDRTTVCWPLLLLSPGSGIKRELRNEGLETLFAGIISKPIKRAQLIATLDGLFAGVSPAPTRPVSPIDAGLASRLPLRILLAEDNPVNQKVARIMIGRLGYAADLAVNGIEVIEALKHRSYDVVLMDVQMPEMDGLEAARTICRLWPDHARPRIIAMTANAMQGDREDCLAAGMSGYLSKPVQIAELQSALEQAGHAVPVPTF
jgi:PAS domain S-box-containing protein